MHTTHTLSAVYPHNWTIASLTYRRTGKHPTLKLASVTCLLGHRLVSLLFRRLDFSAIINRCNYAQRLGRHRSQSPSLGFRWSRHTRMRQVNYLHRAPLGCRFVVVAAATRISLKGERQKSVRFHLSEPSSVVWNEPSSVSVYLNVSYPKSGRPFHKSNVGTLPITAGHNFTL